MGSQPAGPTAGVWSITSAGFSVKPNSSPDRPPVCGREAPEKNEWVARILDGNAGGNSAGPRNPWRDSAEVSGAQHPGAASRRLLGAGQRHFRAFQAEGRRFDPGRPLSPRAPVAPGLFAFLGVLKGSGLGAVVTPVVTAQPNGAPGSPEPARTRTASCANILLRAEGADLSYRSRSGGVPGPKYPSADPPEARAPPAASCYLLSRSRPGDSPSVSPPPSRSP